MDVIVIAIAALFGLVIGSFLNVVVYRVPNGLSVVHPPSACPNCHSEIRHRDNVPVFGWLWLRGKCRDCSEPISVRYPVVEAGTALVFGWFAWGVGPRWVLIGYLWFAAVTIALGLIDFDTKRIPNRILLPGSVVGLILLAIGAAADSAWPDLGRAVLAGLAYFIGFLIVALIIPRGFGMGDVKLAFLLGLFAGFQSWRALIVGVYGAITVGGLIAIVLLIARRVDRNTAIPFGPSMILGCWIAILYADPVLSWYSQISS